MVCVDPDIGYTGARELEKSPSPFTSSLSEYSISKVTLVLVSLHVTVIESDVMVVGVFRVGGGKVAAFTISDLALLLIESVEEIARI